MYHSFENLEVWKRSCSLAVKVYTIFSNSHEFAMKDQMLRAATSIASNIAEGSERSPKEFARFLSIARGSSAELRTQAYISGKAGILTEHEWKEIAEESKEISKMLFVLAKSIHPNSEN